MKTYNEAVITEIMENAENHIIEVNFLILNGSKIGKYVKKTFNINEYKSISTDLVLFSHFIYAVSEYFDKKNPQYEDLIGRRVSMSIDYYCNIKDFNIY